MTDVKILEDRAADAAWAVNESLVGSPTYFTILKALKRAYEYGHSDGRVFEDQLHRRKV